jgi:hypothetical protein
MDLGGRIAALAHFVDVSGKPDARYSNCLLSCSEAYHLWIEYRGFERQAPCGEESRPLYLFALASMAPLLDATFASVFEDIKTLVSEGSDMRWIPSGLEITRVSLITSRK